MERIFNELGLLPYRPRIKCGASTRLGYAQLEEQKQENQVNRDWQTAEAEKARQYDTSERVASQDWQKYMTDYQNEYNAPKNQAVRLREAGINPQIAMSGNVQNVSSSPSGSSPASSPMPSGVSGLSPVSMQPFELQIPNILNSLGSFMKNVGEAQKLGVDTDYAKKSFDLNLRKLTADASLQEFVSKGVQLDNALKYANFDANQKKAVYEYKNLAWQVFLTEQKGISEQLQQKVLKSQERLNEVLSTYHGANADLVKMDVKYYTDMVNAKLDMMRSQSANNYASAQNQSEQAQTTHALRQGLVDAQSLENGLKAVDFDVKSATKELSKTEFVARVLEALAKNKQGKAWTAIFGVPEVDPDGVELGDVYKAAEQLWNNYKKGVQQGIDKVNHH